MNWFMDALRRYADFDGRSRRQAFWMYVLVYVVVVIVLGLIDEITGTYNQDIGWGLLSGIFAIAVIVPSLAVGCRRLHDTGRSGWWQLLGVIPIIGAIILIVWWAQDSHAGENKYGPNPKDEPAPTM